MNPLENSLVLAISFNMVDLFIYLLLLLLLFLSYYFFFLQILERVDVLPTDLFLRENVPTPVSPSVGRLGTLDATRRVAKIC